ncbi:MAG TPA: hypothetical protein VIN58_20450 [Roseateles sp.]
MNMAVRPPMADLKPVTPSDFLPKPVKPSDFGPAAAPAAPQGVATRASASADMAPRQSALPAAPGGPGGPKGPGPDLSAVGKEVAKDGAATAKADAGDSMKMMAEMNALNMQFQMQTAVMQLQKGMNEAVAKTVKDIGKNVSQLAG